MFWWSEHDEKDDCIIDLHWGENNNTHIQSENMVYASIVLHCGESKQLSQVSVQEMLYREGTPVYGQHIADIQSWFLSIFAFNINFDF